jgi:hypothetical protein
MSEANGTDSSQCSQYFPVHAPRHPSHCVHAELGDPPWRHFIAQDFVPHLGPVKPVSQVQVIFRKPIEQLPWLEHWVRFKQNGI